MSFQDFIQFIHFADEELLTLFKCLSPESKSASATENADVENNVGNVTDWTKLCTDELTECFKSNGLCK